MLADLTVLRAGVRGRRAAPSEKVGRLLEWPAKMGTMTLTDLRADELVAFHAEQRAAYDALCARDSPWT